MRRTSISADKVLSILAEEGYGPIVSVPCSFLAPLYDAALAQTDVKLKLLSANNEGEAIALAVGTQLAGQKPIVMIQNSGIGNAFNPLTSLVHTFSIPLLMFVSHRGMAGSEDAFQHELMGKITYSTLELLGFDVKDFPSCDDELQRILSSDRRKNLALVISKGKLSSSLTEVETHRASAGTTRACVGSEKQSETYSFHPAILKRSDVLRLILDQISDDLAVVSTTGKTSREVFFLRDRPGNFYNLGSMGCASSIGLGIALSKAKRKVIVIDGDGSTLMRLEALVGIGHHKPGNLIHFVLDNACHDSTGGQPSQSRTVDLPLVAQALGYNYTSRACDSKTISNELQNALRKRGPHFIHIPILAGSLRKLGRPNIEPRRLAERFRSFCLQQANQQKGMSIE